MASRVAKQNIPGEPKVASEPAKKGCGHPYKSGKDKEGEKQKKR